MGQEVSSRQNLVFLPSVLPALPCGLPSVHLCLVSWSCALLLFRPVPSCLADVSNLQQRSRRNKQSRTCHEEVHRCLSCCDILPCGPAFWLCSSENTITRFLL